MPTLEQLKKENERLRKMQQELGEIRRTNEQRRSLLKENKRLSREIKFGKAIGAGREIKKIGKHFGKGAGKVLAKTGKTAFKGLQKYADFLAEQEKKQKRVNRKLKTVKRKVKKARKKKRK